MSQHVLNSWKEIARYLGRGVRTVQRWERDLFLPVRRPAGKGRSAVLALSDELDLWLRKGPPLAVTDRKVLDHAKAHFPQWQRFITNSEKLAQQARKLKGNITQLSGLIQETANRRDKLQKRRDEGFGYTERLQGLAEHRKSGNGPG